MLESFNSTPASPASSNQGTHDGTGTGGDHDEPYTYRRPTSSVPFPFTERTFGHLLALKGRIEAGAYQYDNATYCAEHGIDGVSITDAINMALLPF